MSDNLPPALAHTRGRWLSNRLTFDTSGDEPGVWYGQCPMHRDRKLRLDLDHGDDLMRLHIGPCGCLPGEVIRRLDLEWVVPDVPATIRTSKAKRHLGVSAAFADLRGVGDPYDRLRLALEAAGMAERRADIDGVRGEGRYRCPACGAAGDGHGLHVWRREDGTVGFTCYGCKAPGNEIRKELKLTREDMGWPSLPDVDWVPDDATGDEPPTQATPSHLDQLRAALVDTAGLDTIPDPEPLVGNDILFRDSLVWVVGKPGCMKSFVMLDLGGCVGTGEHWQGYPVAQGPVLYVVAEGVAGVKKRVRAWEKAYGRRMTGVQFLPIAVQSKNRGQWAALVELARSMAAVLVVIDTQARVTVGVEENSNTEMGEFVDQAEKLRAATKACVGIVHHSGRNGDHGRGATTLEGAVHTIVKVTKDDDMVTLACSKNKDGAEWDDIELRAVPIGESVVLMQHDGRRTNSQTLTPAGRKMARAWWEHHGSDLVASSKLIDIVAPKTTFYRNLQELKRFRLVVQNDTERYPRYQLLKSPEGSEWDS